MKTTSTVLLASAFLLGMMSSCKKSSSSTETTHISTPAYQIGQTIAPGNLSSGSYKGTMTSGNTYTINGAFTVNIGDTVLLQSGVTVCVASGGIIIVKGVLISLGTQSAPNFIEACGITQVNQIGNNPATDPAYGATAGNGDWLGIACDTSCTLCDIQWTHIEYVGGLFPVQEPFDNGASGNNAWPIYFQRASGDLILTDSWIYGSTDDAIRFAGGRIYCARNTFEKLGYTGGDGLNAKNGTQGDMCFNLCIGDATNSTKCSNKGGSLTECNINIYNNTYVDCGYRQTSYGARGSDIDYEQQGEGVCYNNLIVNCRNGIRVGNGENSIPWPDTSHLTISNNYIYADSVWEVNQFFAYNAGSGLKQNYNGINAYIVPTNAQLGIPDNFYSPTSNPNGDVLSINVPALAGANNPMFVNFPLPEHIPAGGNLSDITSVATGVADVGSNYNFRLQSSSPAIGKGFTGFSPFQNIINPVSNDVKNPNFAPTISQPSADMGCYPSSGSGGNQH